MEEQEYVQEIRRLSLVTTESFIDYFWKTSHYANNLNSIISRDYFSLEDLVGYFSQIYRSFILKNLDYFQTSLTQEHINKNSRIYLLERVSPTLVNILHTGFYSSLDQVLPFLMRSYVLEKDYYPGFDVLQISQFLGMLGFEKLNALEDADLKVAFYEFKSKKFQLNTKSAGKLVRDINRNDPRVCPAVLLDSSKKSALSVQINFMREVFKKFQIYERLEKQFIDDELVVGIKEKFSNLRKVPWYNKVKFWT